MDPGVGNSALAPPVEPLGSTRRSHRAVQAMGRPYAMTCASLGGKLAAPGARNSKKMPHGDADGQFVPSSGHNCVPQKRVASPILGAQQTTQARKAPAARPGQVERKSLEGNTRSVPQDDATRVGVFNHRRGDIRVRISISRTLFAVELRRTGRLRIDRRAPKRVGIASSC